MVLRQNIYGMLTIVFVLYLSILFNLCVSHGFISEDCLITDIVPPANNGMQGPHRALHGQRTRIDLAAGPEVAPHGFNRTGFVAAQCRFPARRFLAV